MNAMGHAIIIARYIEGVVQQLRGNINKIFKHIYKIIYRILYILEKTTTEYLIYVILQITQKTIIIIINGVWKIY